VSNVLALQGRTSRVGRLVLRLVLPKVARSLQHQRLIAGPGRRHTDRLAAWLEDEPGIWHVEKAFIAALVAPLAREGLVAPGRSDQHCPIYAVVRLQSVLEPCFSWSGGWMMLLTPAKRPCPVAQVNFPMLPDSVLYGGFAIVVIVLLAVDLFVVHRDP